MTGDTSQGGATGIALVNLYTSNVTNDATMATIMNISPEAGVGTSPV